VLLGGDAELVVEGVVPDLLHCRPSWSRCRARWGTSGSGYRAWTAPRRQHRRGRPTMLGNSTARGASSPANPALHIPDPLSTTKAWTSSSEDMLRKGKVGREACSAWVVFGK
jgi:hypothetical protein